MNRACENDAVAIGVHGGPNLLSSPFFLGLVTPVYGELKVVPLNFVSSNLPRVSKQWSLAFSTCSSARELSTNVVVGSFHLINSLRTSCLIPKVCSIKSGLFVFDFEKERGCWHDPDGRLTRTFFSCWQLRRMCSVILFCVT